MNKSALVLLTISFLVYTSRHQSLWLPELKNDQRSTLLTARPLLETESRFKETEVVRQTKIPFKTEYVGNPEKDADDEDLVKVGRDGERKEILAATTWWGQSLGETLKKVEVVPAQNAVVERGTQVSWKEAIFNGQKIRYWKKFNVWATSYDGHCSGCRGKTWAGTEVVWGTCAVDPKIIPLGSHFYVPGYGTCSALDVGGAIKGNRIDLGFVDVSEGFWSARFVDIYLLDSAPHQF